LGFRRLSIIDLDGGHQPMSDADESIWVAFNGEIYNFPELRAELESHGHRFRTRSDTEVIVHGYKQWGTGILKRLNGMFGLAIWDEREHRLVLARDRSGIKLVYFKVANGTVWFGSELRAVLAALRTAPQVDVTAVGLFLRYRYTPSPYTLHEGIRKLAPGSMAVFEQGAFRLEHWHRPAESMQRPPDDDEAIDQLLEIYKRALSRHLLSDVPVGLLLSGGVDSGLLLGLMSLFGDRWPTFSIGYGTKLYKNDELAGAARTAALFSARHTMVQMSVGTFERALPTIVSALEEPVAASSIVPMYYVCERARQDVKVALVGQGPDELFGGYKRHLGIRYGNHWRSMPSWIRSGVGAAINRLPRNETLRRGLYALDVTERAQRYRNALSIMPGDRISSLFRQEHRVEQAAEFACWERLERESNDMDELSGFQHLETGSTLPDELLMYADKLSMAHGLEVRVPYLDNEVVDFAQRLAPAQKIRLGRQKWIHRRVCERFLPPEILRRKKRGFAV
ncbi:MAG: asparagine synthase (glutamine-hydrolyzing), partial [Gammaproteobacteria bacterium]